MKVAERISKCGGLFEIFRQVFFEEVILGESKKALYLMEDNRKARMFDYQLFSVGSGATYDLIYKKPNLSHI